MWKMQSLKSILRRMFPNMLNVVVFTLFVAVPAVWLAIWLWSAGNERFDRTKAESLVREIQAGRFPPDRFGAIVVPPYLVSQGWDSEAFVGYHGGLRVFFFTYRVRGDWAGYLYSSEPIGRTDEPGRLWLPVYGGELLPSLPAHQVSGHWWYVVHRVPS